ncbi:MAG TPA: protein tyrosine phosphatase family protein [Roseiflexaceae bacterium]|nr:protein tyrosine phosphatase family protein [Roseiflexaceae bacterium]HMP40850.1 protein tyrosine phosphatase family protein [Roseiflexaceae bacterium]
MTTTLCRTETGADRRAELIRYTIDDRLTFAGQPQPEDWAALAAEGFDTVINMRSDAERAAMQQQSAVAAGLRYIHLPLPVYELEPQHLAEYHELLAAQNGRVLLHCRSATRVALMWLLDRVVYDGWSRERAEQALRDAGYGASSLETFSFCADDYFDRAGIAN